MGTNRIRATAIAKVAALRSTAPLDFLRAATIDPDEAARIVACVSLAALADYSDPEWLIPALQDKDYEVRGQAEHALLKFGNRVPIEPLLAALIRRGPDFEDPLAEVLGTYKDHFPRHYLDSLVSTHPQVAAVVLGELGDAAPIDLAIALLSIPYTEKTRALRFEALEAACKLKHPDLAPILNQIMRDAGDFSRYAAAGALATIGDPAYLPDILAVMQSNLARGMYHIADGLVAYGEQMPVAEMVECIRTHTDNREMYELTVALHNAGRNTPVDFLMDLALDAGADPYVRGGACKVLATVVAAHQTHPGMIEEIQTLLVELLTTEGDALLRGSIAFALGLTKDEHFTSVLCSRVIEEKNGYVATNAAHGLYLLARSGMHAPIVVWTTILEKTADARRKFAILALDCRDDAPSDVFLAYLSDEHLLELATTALIKHPPANISDLARQALSEFAPSMDDPLYVAASAALAKIGPTTL